MDTMSRLRARLVVISEPSYSPLNSRRNLADSQLTERRSGIELARMPFLIGRQHDNLLIINDEQVSAHHARITFDGSGYYIEDLVSTNGTFVDGMSINTATQLTPDCLIKIGGTLLKFECYPSPDLF